MRDVQVLGDELARVRQVIEQSTWRPIRRVHRAQETPRVGQQLSHRRRLELGEEGSSVDTPEVREVSVEVELLSDNGVPRGLLQVEAGRRDEVARGEEVGQLGADVPVHLEQGFLEICPYCQRCIFNDGRPTHCCRNQRPCPVGCPGRSAP
jgi:hypothetical protein